MSNISRLLTTAAAAGGGTVEAVGVDFDGTNDYLSRSSDMTGNADGKTFTFSCAVYLTTTNATQIFRQDDGYTNIWLRNGNQLEINVYNTVGGWGLKAYADVFIPFNTWTIIIASFDMSDTSKRHIYFGDLQTTPTYPTFVNSTLDFTRTPIAVGANTISGISQQLKGRLSNLFLDYTYRDLSIESNRRLFIDADGKPASGQSSLSPILYLPMDDPADPGRNDGTGGDFTLNGIVARSGRGPNQYNAAASTFDGTADYLSKAAVTGMSDSKVLNVSFNFNMQSPSAGNILSLYNGGGVNTFQVGIDLFGGQWRMQIQGRSSSTEILYALIGLSRNFVNDKWQNYSISLDMANTSNRLVYIDGVDYTSNVTWYTYTNAAFNITNKSEVMRESSNYVGGSLSALWFNPTYIDLSADNPFYDTAALFSFTCK